MKRIRKVGKVMLNKAAIEILGLFHYNVVEEDLMGEEAEEDAVKDYDHMTAWIG